MNRKFRIIFAVLTLTVILLAVSVPALAADKAEASSVAQEAESAPQASDKTESDTIKYKAFSAAILVGIAAVAGAVSMAVAVKSASDGIARQPEAAGNIRTNTMLGLVFIETAIIYALIVGILIVFVL